MFCVYSLFSWLAKSLSFFLRCFVLLLLLLGGTSIQAAPLKSITVVTAASSPLNTEFFNHLKTELNPLITNGLKLSIVRLGDLPKHSLQESDGHLLIAVGVQALSELSQRKTQLPIFGVFIPQSSYDSIWNQTKRSQQQFSAILLDQPFNRQINLLKNLLPKIERAGVLYGPTSHRYSDELRQVAIRENIVLAEQEVFESAELTPKLKLILEDSQALLAIPDPSIYSRETAQTILLTSYRYQKPVIGFSQAYVKAGALAAVYSSPSQIAKQAAEIIMQTQETLPLPRFPKYFSVDINRQVARSLSIDLQDEHALSEALLKMERQSP